MRDIFTMPSNTRTHKDNNSKAICKRLGDKSVVLIGLMGAGKSAIGRRLATRLDIPFIDADSEIELAAGKNIADIFADHGEAYFRDGERKVIARLLGSGPQVLATGGGAYMNNETRETIECRGISVWLKAELNILMERVGRRDHRPLLKTRDPKAVMQRLMDERYPVYAKAGITVESRKVPHEEIVDDIIDALTNSPALAGDGGRQTGGSRGADGR